MTKVTSHKRTPEYEAWLKQSTMPATVLAGYWTNPATLCGLFVSDLDYPNTDVHHDITCDVCLFKNMEAQ